MSNVVVDPFIVFPAGGFSSPLDHGAALLFWWDAAQGVVLATPPDVDTWTDQEASLVAAESSGGNNLAELVDPSLNGEPGIDFEIGASTSTRLEVAPDTAINNIWTKGTETILWMVVQMDSQGDGYFLDKGWNSPSVGWAILQLAGGKWRWRQRSSGTDHNNDTTNTVATGAHYLQVTWDGDMTAFPEFKVDGVVNAIAGSPPGSGSPSSDTTANLIIGNKDPSGGNHWGGKINEIYATVDSAIDPSEDETYITNRWGL